jgi:hypothetical protein
MNDGKDSIYYTQFKRVKKDADGEPMTGIGKIFPLMNNLTFEPTAMEYCFREKVLYICAGPYSGELAG